MKKYIWLCLLLVNNSYAMKNKKQFSPKMTYYINHAAQYLADQLWKIGIGKREFSKIKILNKSEAEFKQAVIEGDLVKVDRFISLGADVNIIQTGMYNHSLLMEAAKKNDIAMVKRLIDAKADVNYNLTVHGDTPLYYAVANQSLPVMKLLIESGADPEIASIYTVPGTYNFTNKDYKVVYMPALTMAIRNNQIKIVRYLLDIGVELKAAIQMVIERESYFKERDAKFSLGQELDQMVLDEPTRRSTLVESRRKDLIKLICTNSPLFIDLANLIIVYLNGYKEYLESNNEKR